MKPVAVPHFAAVDAPEQRCDRSRAFGGGRCAPIGAAGRLGAAVAAIPLAIHYADMIEGVVLPDEHSCQLGQTLRLTSSSRRLSAFRCGCSCSEGGERSHRQHYHPIAVASRAWKRIVEVRGLRSRLSLSLPDRGHHHLSLREGFLRHAVPASDADAFRAAAG